MHKNIHSSHLFKIYKKKKKKKTKKTKKKQVCSLFPKVKTSANYAEICRAGKLEADFQQVPLVQFF